MKHLFTVEAADDLAYWKKHDQRKVERIKALLDDIKVNHPKGIGKPEPLRHQKTGLWSRRIDREHRLVYSVENDTVIVYACRFHYER